ncbi:hypothetical protein GA0115253_107476 [Streptomyces sp. Termitarium-T10T-6]|nr:hypothetical protein GA0115253_107476 [Streptomyces sp. Termitarium-T10T-6]
MFPQVRGERLQVDQDRAVRADMDVARERVAVDRARGEVGTRAAAAAAKPSRRSRR